MNYFIKVDPIKLFPLTIFQTAVMVFEKLKKKASGPIVSTKHEFLSTGGLMAVTQQRTLSGTEAESTAKFSQVVLQ